MTSQSGFSYLEVLIAMMIMVIILAPILPALTQAQSNYRVAITRRKAQGLAATVAHSARANPGDALDIIQGIHNSNPEFSLRLTFVPRGDEGISGQHSIGDSETMPPFVGAGFQTEYPDLFIDMTFVISEVFDASGSLSGLFVAKINHNLP